MTAERCESCGQNPATVHYVEVVAGEKKSRAMCQECLQAKGFVIDPQIIQKAAAPFLKALLPTVPAKAKVRPPCPVCGLHWSDFRENSRLGCATCYEHFPLEIEEVLDRVQGTHRHTGRGPAHLLARRERRQRTDLLRAELQSAIEAEDYERAARLRDTLRQCEGEGEGEAGRATV